MNQNRIRVPDLREKKRRGEKGEKSVMLTAYDATMARLLDGLPWGVRHDRVGRRTASHRQRERISNCAIPHRRGMEWMRCGPGAEAVGPRAIGVHHVPPSSRTPPGRFMLIAPPRYPFGRYTFLSFDSADAGRAWIAQLAEHIPSARVGLDAHASGVGLVSWSTALPGVDVSRLTAAPAGTLGPRTAAVTSSRDGS